MENLLKQFTNPKQSDERVDDIKKAEEMAYAEKPYRDEIARTSKEIDVKKSGINNEETGEELLKLYKLNERANSKAEATGKQYDIEQKKLAIAHKLENNEELSDKELAFLKNTKDKIENDESFANSLNHEEKELYGAGIKDFDDMRLFIKERKDLEKKIGVLSDDERKLEIELRKAGEWNNSIERKIMRYRDETEKDRALTDENHPYHKDMVRIYEKIKEGQKVRAARMKKELADTQSALRKLEDVGISDYSLDYYEQEVDRICNILSDFESQARSEAYQMAKLNAMIDGKLKETNPLNVGIDADY